MGLQVLNKAPGQKVKKEWGGRAGEEQKRRYSISCRLLPLLLPRAHRPPSPSLQYLGLALAQTGFAAGARCRPRLEREETYPSQTEAPYQARGRETVAVGPGASVGRYARPLVLRLQPGSRSQNCPRSPKLPRLPGRRRPSAHPAARSARGHWV